MTLVPVEFDSSELITNLVNTISERARAKGLEFITDIDESVPSRLYGDDVRISQIVMNLLTNAVKYTESGSVTLRVRNNGITDGNAKLRFEVEDTGIGIKDEDLGKLFESFKRIEEKRNRHIEGTGLGISIVCKLLAMMDSKLHVESQYAIGSTFGFDLKLRVIDPEPVGKYDEKRKSVLSTEGETHIYAPKAKILVTDDNGMNLKVAINFMKIFGITPVTCSSGKETIDLMRTGKFDIVFLDHMMPVMDGMETLKVLKDENLLNGTVVIALTANAVVGAETQYLNAGFDGYLSKPVTVNDIEKTLKKFLPADVIESGASDASGSKTSKLSMDKLRTLGLNVDAALVYTCNDEDFYMELLSDYAKSASDKCHDLSSYLENGDLKNYEILVHSLKSASKTVGADDVSEQAKALEEASRNKDVDFVNEHHKAFVESFTELAGKILG